MTRPSILRLRTLVACAAVLATAGFVVWAVQFSDFGKHAGSVTVPTAPPRAPSPIAIRLANAIGRASLGGRHRLIDMRAVAPFAWTRVYLYAHPSPARIRRQLGPVFAEAATGVPPREGLVMFAHIRGLAATAAFSSAFGRLDCVDSPAGYARGTVFVVRYARRAGTPVPYLSTRHPRAHEQSCLRAAGA